MPGHDRRPRQQVPARLWPAQRTIARPSGLGIRLDAGTAFSGAVITPFYDSLLVKVTAHGLRFVDAARRMERCLQEFRVRGVKTNIPFLINLVTHPELSGRRAARRASSTRRRSCSSCPSAQDRATKVLTYIADVIVNGHPEVAVEKPAAAEARSRSEPCRRLPHVRGRSRQPTRRRARATSLTELGPEKFATWVREQKQLLHHRHDLPRRPSIAAGHADAHLRHAARSPPVYAAQHADLFSLEMWGGATFDTSHAVPEGRSLAAAGRAARAHSEHPVPDAAAGHQRRRLHQLSRQRRARRSSRNRPQAGIDLFRIFDALNWLPNMKLAIEAVRQARHASAKRPSATPATFSTRQRTKYDLKYYVELAKELEKLGAHILAIKDMAGLCKPYAAQKLVQDAASKRSASRSTSTPTIPPAGRSRRCCMAAEEGRRHRRCRHGAALRHDQPAEPERAGRVRCASPSATPAWISTALQTTADYWEGVRSYYLPVRDAASSPPAPRSIATKCPAASTRICISRRRRSASATAGPKSAGCTPRSIGCSATSSR